MSQKWNLQDIKPVSGRKPRREAPDELTERPKKEIPREEAEEAASIVVENGSEKKKGRLRTTLLIFVLLLGAGFAVNLMLGGATLTVFPRYREPNVNATFVAHKEATADQLPYEIMTLEAEGERQVQASGEEQVTEQAEGTIMIYNNHQEAPIRLVTNTRFASPEGLIFRIKDPAVVPGYSMDENGERAPGVVTAEVFADEAGEDYNIAPTRFTIPGFEGSPEYDNVYAESSEAFSGGFDGRKFIIEDEELQMAQQALRTELRNSLLERIPNEQPAGVELFQGAVTFTYETLPAVAYGDDLATIKEKVYMRIPLFKEDDFARFIAEATVPGYEGGDVRITDTDVLDFDYTSATTSASDISAADQLEFELEGRPQIVWEYDADALRADLVTKNRTALSSVLSGYPAIERADATIRPFWKKTFPMEIEEIEIIERIEE